MVQSVPIEKHIIPMVLLLNIHLIKGTDYFPCDLAGYRAIPMVRLVPIEKHAIPMVLLVNMHHIKRLTGKDIKQDWQYQFLDWNCPDLLSLSNKVNNFFSSLTDHFTSRASSLGPSGSSP